MPTPVSSFGVVQVLPDVLHVCQRGVHFAELSQVPELATSISVLPLEHLPPGGFTLLGHYVHEQLVLRPHRHDASSHRLQVH